MGGGDNTTAKATKVKSSPPVAAGSIDSFVDRSPADPMNGTLVAVTEAPSDQFVGVEKNTINPEHQLKDETKDAKTAKADKKIETENKNDGHFSWLTGLFKKSGKETTEKKATTKGDGYTSWLDRKFGEEAKAKAAAAEAAKNNPTKVAEKTADGENKIAAAKVVTGKVNKDELRRNHFVDGRKTHKNVESSAPTEAKVTETPAKADTGTTVAEKSATTSLWGKFKAAAGKVFGTQKAEADEAPEVPATKKGPPPVPPGPSVNC